MKLNPNVTITDDGFIEVLITKEMYDRATEKAAELGQLKNSIRSGEGNLAGFLGEEAVLVAFEDAVSTNTYQHDVTLPDRTWEVKSKDRTVTPDLSQEGSVAAYNTRQGADEYIFTSIYREGGKRNEPETGRYTKVYIVGTQAKARYYRRARELTAGQRDGSNNFIVQADCFNLHYRFLERPWAEEDEIARTA